jgi:hypothetical protein
LTNHRNKSSKIREGGKGAGSVILAIARGRWKGGGKAIGLLYLTVAGERKGTKEKKKGARSI